MPTMSESERKKKDSRGSTGEVERIYVLVDAIVLDDRTREHVDALLECLSYPDSRLFGLSSAEQEDHIKELLKQDERSWPLSADCKSFAELQALARIYRQIWY
jgi:hypothetical protein